MPFPNPDTQFKPGESGNPAGKPKGAKHLSTHIQEMLNDEEFETYLEHPAKGYVPFKGAPIKAIVTVALRKAAAGDDKAREWLAKYGYGTKLQLSNDPENPINATPIDPTIVSEWTDFLKNRTHDG